MAARNGNDQGSILEVRVLGGIRLKDTNTLTIQSPFVKLEYGSKERRTVTSKRGGVNPSFQDKFEFELIEGIQKIKVTAYNERTFSKNVLIGTGKINLQDVLLNRSAECTCLLFNNSESAGEIKLLLTYPNNGPRPDPHQASSSAYPPNYGAQATHSHRYRQMY